MSYVRPAARAHALRLHFNENTAGCSPAVLDALRSLTREDAAWYPDYAAITARTAASLGVPADWVQLTNGLDEGLMTAAQFVARQALRDGTGARAHALVVEPAFEMYAACADTVGLRLVRIESGPDFAFPLDAVLAAITPDTRLVYLTDPNNPTGLALPAGALDAIAAAAAPAGALVVLDEAYAEFSGRTAIGDTLDRLRHVVVGRTFAKAHGLAALRIGALVAHPSLMGRLQPLFAPYSVNVAAMRALEAALDDRAYLEAYVAGTRESRARIYDFCRRAGLKYWPSDANFVLVRIGADAAAVVAAMADRGVVVRDKSAAPGCAGCVRITAGVVAHTTQALAALEDVLASRSH